MPFHVELRDHRDTVRAFNLAAAEVRERFLRPLRAGRPFTFQEKDFDPRSARLTVIEGAQLAPGELGLGQGWTNAVKRGRDVTEGFLAELREEPHAPAIPRPVASAADAPGVDAGLSERVGDRLLGRLAAGELALGDGFALTAELMAGHRVSARLAVFEQVVWQLLHAGTLALHPRAGQPALERSAWEAVLLDPATWLVSGPDSPVISATA